MVAALLATALLAFVVPTWGGEAHQLCLSCHPEHYTERGGCSGCHLGNPGSERKNIAHAGLRAGKYSRFTLGDAVQMREGERLIAQLACRRCHVSGGRGNRHAVSLDASAARKAAGELVLSLRHPVANMPDFALNEEQVTTLVNAIFAGSEGRAADKTAPVRVHFTTSVTKNADVFSTKCGSCHQLLSQRLGAAGSGKIGPNLSGLLSIYYPKTFRNDEAWTGGNLTEWVKNPRKIRLWSGMQPLAITAAETKELESIILLSPEKSR